MKEQRRTTLRKLENSRKESLYLIVRGVEVGVVSALVCVLYRYLLNFAESYLLKIIGIVKGSPIKTVVWIMALAIIGAIVAFIVKKEPIAGGSGIPQVSAELGGYMNPSWWRVIVAKLVGSTASVFAGLSLGREGPSIQLGAMGAKGVARLTKADITTERRMISCGAGAGLSAAFNAPLAGIVFVLEEIQHTFDKSVLCMGLVSAVTADFVSKLFFGQNTIFNYQTSNIPLKYYWLLIILGIILGISGAIYNTTMMKAQDLYKKIIKIPAWAKMAIVFAVSGVVGLFVEQILCGGHHMAEYLIEERPTLGVMIFLLVAKYLFGVFSFCSGAPGGTLYPLSIIGTYIGAIFGTVAIDMFGLNPELWQEFVVIGMAGFFGAIVRAPITGIVIVFEISGNMKNILPLAVVSFVAYAVANLLGSEPFYASSLKRVLKNNNISEKSTTAGEKVIETLVVPIGSKIAGKTIADVDWGRHCLIVSITRNDVGITPKGDTVIKEGDELVLLVSQRRFSKDKKRLEKIISV